MIILATPDQPKPGLGFSAVVIRRDLTSFSHDEARNARTEAQQVAHGNGVTVIIAPPGVGIELIR